MPIKWSSNIEAARSAAVKADVMKLETALEAFRVDTGRYPTQIEGLQTLIQPPSNAPVWRGPYVKMIPRDPWGKPYLYVSPGQRHPDTFDLSSAGPDGRLGTADDIVNWAK